MVFFAHVRQLADLFFNPPFGYALLYFKGVAPEDYTMMHIYRGILPFVLLQLIGLLIIALFPGLVTWLPSIFFSWSDSRGACPAGASGKADPMVGRPRSLSLA